VTHTDKDTRLKGPNLIRWRFRSASSSSHRTTYPPFNYRRRAFSVAVSRLWNILLQNVTSVS